MKLWALLGVLIAGPVMAQSPLAVDYSGTWHAEGEHAGKNGQWWLTDVAVNGSRVTGWVQYDKMCGKNNVSGTLTGNKLRLEAHTRGCFTIAHDLVVEGNTLTGTYTNNSKMVGKITAKTR